MKRESEFFFEEWASLAKGNPDEFERRRQQTIEDFLLASGSQRTLGETLQREIDSVRRRAESPDAALLAVTTMLAEQLSFLGEELDVLREDLRAVQNLPLLCAIK